MAPVLRSLILPFLFCAGGFSTTASAQTVFTFLARLDGAQETPPVPTAAVGLGVVTIDTVSNVIQFRVSYAGLSSNEVAAHIHGFSPPGVPSGVIVTLTGGTPKCDQANFSEAQQANYLAGLSYFNIHSANFTGGEIRGQISEAPGHTNLCFGDGSGAACPCGNNSMVGEAEGCLNSLGTGARLRAYGSASFANDMLVMHHSRGTDSSTLLFQGLATTGGGGGVPFGDGLRCVTQSVQRLGTKTACEGTQIWPDVGETHLCRGTSSTRRGTATRPRSAACRRSTCRTPCR
jgi:hypothetical protein